MKNFGCLMVLAGLNAVALSQETSCNFSNFISLKFLGKVMKVLINRKLTGPGSFMG